MENKKKYSWQNDKVVSVPYDKNLTVSDLKKMIEGIPDDYELVWSNQFEGVNEWVQTMVEDSLSKTLYFMADSISKDCNEEDLRRKAVLRRWQQAAYARLERDKNCASIDELCKALEEIEN